MGLFEDVLTTVKKVRDVAQKTHDAELQGMIADLMLSVADIKVEMSKLHDENAELRKRVSDLTRAAEFRSKVEFRTGYYYLKDPLEGYAEGPFCPVCLDEDGLLITVVKRQGGIMCLRCYRRTHSA